jgi:MFS family permease
MPDEKNDDQNAAEPERPESNESVDETEEEEKSPLQEIVQPFIDLINAPRALWGINLAYVIEGMVYFGMLSYLTIHFSSFIFQGVEKADVWSHWNVMVLTAGITIAMFFLGFVADKKGIRFALIAAFCLMLFGRILISAAPTAMGLEPNGIGSALHIVTLVGILFVVVGYGMYQPAAYAGIKQFTTPKTAAMGFAMLYALMNLGGWLPTYAFMLRDKNWLDLGIPGTYWVYTAFTLVALISTIIILTPRTVQAATRSAKEETERIKAKEKKDQDQGVEAEKKPEPGESDRFRPEDVKPALADRIMNWLRNHPLTDTKFAFFIFALIPVQTLFTYNWLVLPQYISRTYEGWIGEYFEIASNSNPILIFIAVPIITALTHKKRVYNMMIIGTLVMAAPAFLLAIGPYWWTLFGYILIMTLGEAMWQPRFLQYAAQIAPEGRTGEYMGVAQLPWFLTKVLVPLFYSGWMMDRFCPEDGPKDTRTMWFIFACIAMTSTLLLVLARNWVGKDFKEKA